MTLKIDLHSHSTASDGTLTPTELVMRAVEAGVDVLALTDHDTTEGIAEALTAAENRPLELIPGIEISVTWNSQVVHIVGLGVDIQCQTLQEGLAPLRQFRDWRAEEIGRRLAKVGIEGAYEGAKALSNGKLVSRTHFARFLVNQGYVSETKKVFQKYLTRGKPGHVPGEWAELSAAVGWIKAAGGQAVIAHPARYPFTRTKLRRLIGEFVEAGGDAIEVVSGSHSRDDNFTMARHAIDFGLKGSQGSDYHGPENSWAELGRLAELPSGVVPIWRDWTLIANRLSA
ncbi:MAG: PHP domain-containing protein [Chromatiales bacterium]|nr:PHP domain-containing protein [Chromatiales bacterium]